MTFQSIKYYELPFLIRVLGAVSSRWPNHGYNSSGLDSSYRRDASILMSDLRSGGKTFLDDRDREVIERAFRQARDNSTYYLAGDACSETIVAIDRELMHILKLIRQAAPIAIEKELHEPVPGEEIVQWTYDHVSPGAGKAAATFQAAFFAFFYTALEHTSLWRSFRDA